MQSATMRVLQPPPDENATEEEREQLESTQGILKFLPLMIGFFSLQVPAGLTIYWFTSNLFTVSQSLIIRGYYKANPPEIELPDYWDALDKGEARKAAHNAGARLSGVVKWFDRPKGYGFISPSIGGKDIFVHQTQVHAPGFRSLAPGEDVEYVVGELDGRTHAVEVTGPGGAFVKGTPKPKEEEVY